LSFERIGGRCRGGGVPNGVDAPSESDIGASVSRPTGRALPTTPSSNVSRRRRFELEHVTRVIERII
jgi:hypothetical protein